MLSPIDAGSISMKPYNEFSLTATSIGAAVLETNTHIKDHGVLTSQDKVAHVNSLVESLSSNYKSCLSSGIEILTKIHNNVLILLQSNDDAKVRAEELSELLHNASDDDDIKANHIEVFLTSYKNLRDDLSDGATKLIQAINIGIVVASTLVRLSNINAKAQHIRSCFTNISSRHQSRDLLSSVGASSTLWINAEASIVMFNCALGVGLLAVVAVSASFPVNNSSSVVIGMYITMLFGVLVGVIIKWTVYNNHSS